MTLHGFSPRLYEDVLKYSQLLDGVICTNKLGCVLAGQTGGMQKARVYYAPYGVSVPEPKPKSADKQTLRIIHVGRLGENFQKRVTDIPAIIDLLDRSNLNYELRIVGSGEEEAGLREKMRAQISKKKVSFTGALFGEALSKMYDWADVMLLTSFWETGPIVVWEAMVRKVAVVSSAYIGSKSEGSLIDGQNCFLFPVGDSKAAAECLVKFADPALRAKLSENGYKMVSDKYTRERSVAMWTEAFSKILLQPTRALARRITDIGPSGRLDSFLGTSLAEGIRNILGIRFEHSGPGGEWPHTYSGKAQDDKSFWELAKTLDGGVIE